MTIHRPFTRRERRELKTVHAMLRLHCRARHGSRDLCGPCGDLWDYARARIAACPFCPDKPTCVNCPVHCYKPDMRERIRQVMRFAGPRMLGRHPLLALLHLVDGRRDRNRRLPTGRPLDHNPRHQAPKTQV
jgi:hypothetical protein